MENKIVIKFNNGRELVAELDNYDGEHPEIIVYMKEEGLVVQDICLIRPHQNDWTEADQLLEEEKEGDIDVLVWEDEYDEDYTRKHIIHQYNEDEEVADENI